jgi:hypothetical protein
VRIYTHCFRFCKPISSTAVVLHCATRRATSLSPCCRGPLAAPHAEAALKCVEVRMMLALLAFLGQWMAARCTVLHGRSLCTSSDCNMSGNGPFCCTSKFRSDQRRSDLMLASESSQASVPYPHVYLPTVCYKLHNHELLSVGVGHAGRI